MRLLLHFPEFELTFVCVALINEKRSYALRREQRGVYGKFGW